MNKVIVLILVILSASAAQAVDVNPGFAPCGSIIRVAKSNLQAQVWDGWISQAQADAEVERIASTCSDGTDACWGEKQVIEMHQRWVSAVIAEACKSKRDKADRACIDKFMRLAK